jgi:hypothetical protein
VDERQVEVKAPTTMAADPVSRLRLAYYVSGHGNSLIPPDIPSAAKKPTSKGLVMLHVFLL